MGLGRHECCKTYIILLNILLHGFKLVLSADDVFLGGPDGAGDRPTEDRRKVLVVGGVQTSFGYQSRRELLRQTWFPATQQELDKLEREQSFVLRFVVGQTDDAQAEAELQREAALHGGFLRIAVKEEYQRLSYKSHEFIKEAMRHFDMQYVIKMDDDLYLQVDRVPAIVQQWLSSDKDYVGCFFVGAPVYTDPRNKWYEPQQALFPGRYHSYAQGTIYGLSRHAVDLVMALPEDSNLRYFKSEDVTVGLWMAVLQVNFWDDARMCAGWCSNSSVAVRDPMCAGLCRPKEDMVNLHNSPACHAPPPAHPGDLPYAGSQFNFSHRPHGKQRQTHIRRPDQGALAIPSAGDDAGDGGAIPELVFSQTYHHGAKRGKQGGRGKGQQRPQEQAQQQQQQQRKQAKEGGDDLPRWLSERMQPLPQGMGDQPDAAAVAKRRATTKRRFVGRRHNASYGAGSDP